ncbi:type IV secretion system protein VirB9 [Nitrosospira multiformis]|uniref:Type IV secretion system protein VirB9 n=1 Tax=Nitrosospira multiformis TaxID=1231 RepID=A0A1H8MMD9_9PROT|nr:P-type conjugative transfer protein TrbG [Nitrosospira multiformis]SEO18601.1 type IV secretion system protein VirB9 [Nitrosospira multiformis]
MKIPLQYLPAFSPTRLAAAIAAGLPLVAVTAAIANNTLQQPELPELPLPQQSIQPPQRPQLSRAAGYIPGGQDKLAGPQSPPGNLLSGPPLPPGPPAPGALVSSGPSVPSAPPMPPIPVASVPDLPDAPEAASPQALHFSNPEIKLSPQERAVLALAKKWKAGASTQGVKPVIGGDGTIRFLYGATQPSIICAVLQVCDVELQPGEQVNSLHLGDTARWTVEPAVTGSGRMEVQHLIIKPMDTGLETSLIVTTDRRTYHLRLRSHRTEFMPRVAFTYPDEAMAKWEKIRRQEQAAHDNQVMPGTGEYLGNLDFDYTIEGQAARWKPLRVYNDGVKTIIQMPGTLNQTEAPILLVVRKDGGFFTDEESVQVNYRLQNDRFIVDSIFDKAILVAGVGSNQDRVTIKRGK